MNSFQRLLRRPQDAVLFLLWITLGLVPSALFFIWIERNCTLPWIPQQLHWPWLVIDGSLADWISADVVLLSIFGAIHSGLAAPALRNRLLFFVHPKNHRAAYVIATGLSCLIVMAHWQATGEVAFALFQRATTNTLLSLILFWTLMLFVMRVSEPLGMGNFLGLRDLLSTPEEWQNHQETPQGGERLVISGAYARVRHPIYTLTLAATLLTPFLSLDRLIVFAAFFGYIQIGYRLEERKLLRTFGPAYEEYRKKVPALFPKL